MQLLMTMATYAEANAHLITSPKKEVLINSTFFLILKTCLILNLS
jgi:hypothetical protein